MRVLTILLLLIAPCAIVIIAAYFFNESAAWHPECPFRTLTHFYCPGCGTLRALHALSGGHIVQAIDHNILTVIFLPYLIFMWGVYLLRTITGKKIVLPQFRKAPIILLIVITVFFIIRNIPVYPLSLLAP